MLRQGAMGMAGVIGACVTLALGLGLARAQDGATEEPAPVETAAESTTTSEPEMEVMGDAPAAQPTEEPTEQAEMSDAIAPATQPAESEVIEQSIVTTSSTVETTADDGLRAPKVHIREVKGKLVSRRTHWDLEISYKVKIDYKTAAPASEASVKRALVVYLRKDHKALVRDSLHRPRGFLIPLEVPSEVDTDEFLFQTNSDGDLTYEGTVTRSLPFFSFRLPADLRTVSFVYDLDTKQPLDSKVDALKVVDRPAKIHD